MPKHLNISACGSTLSNQSGIQGGQRGGKHNYQLSLMSCKHSQK